MHFPAPTSLSSSALICKMEIIGIGARAVVGGWMKKKACKASRMTPDPQQAHVHHSSLLSSSLFQSSTEWGNSQYSLLKWPESHTCQCLIWALKQSSLGPSWWTQVPASTSPWRPSSSRGSWENSLHFHGTERWAVLPQQHKLGSWQSQDVLLRDCLQH